MTRTECAYYISLMGLEVGYVCAEVFFNTVLTIGAADAALLDTGMESLDGFEMETVDVGFAKFKFSYATGSTINIVCKY